jgi:DNA-directed RNA polymerase subunit RPC12/RpoP
MLVRLYTQQVEYIRSKRGKPYPYHRTHGVALLRCDCCGSEFERRVSQIDPRRLTDEHRHVCPNCPSKKFAQSKGVESRRFWNTTVDLDQDINEL